MNTIEKLAIGRYRVGTHRRLVGALAGTLLAFTGLILSGCASSPASGRGPHVLSAADVALVRFTSCGDALRNLQAAASNTVTASPSGAATAAAGPGQTGPTAASGATGAASGLQDGAAAPNPAGAARAA